MCLVACVPAAEIRSAGLRPYRARHRGGQKGCRELEPGGSGQDTHIASFRDVQTRVVRGWPSGDGLLSLSALMRDALQMRKDTCDKERKQHNTAGFFCECVRKAAERVQRMSGDATTAHPARQDWGRFADVGHHTSCVAPTTCWAIVVAALESVLTAVVRPCVATAAW